jgi:phage repressor protein C with HTH and peptisase S24 domain
MKSARLVRREGERPLSGEALADLMRAVLSKGKPLRFRAKGPSMAPFIKDGDAVTVRPLGGARPRTGDIAAYLHPVTGRVGIHRIVREKSGQFSLKGDNLSGGDGTLSLGQILGIVCRVERAGKNVHLGRRRGGALIASLSRSGWLTRAVDVARRVSGRKHARDSK